MNYINVTVSIPMVKETTEFSVTSPSHVFDFCKDMQKMAKESFQILTLNVRNIVINRHMIALGTLDSCLVHPREVFKECIMDSAAAFIAVHNHPSGDTTPSTEDLRITRTLVDAGKLLSINILDHVIIGNNSFSIRESGMVAF